MKTSRISTMPDIEKFLLSKRISAHKPKVKVVQKKRLAEAEPTVFTYDDLDPDSNQIRLLRILPPKLNSRERRRENSQEVLCEIFHANLDEHPSYKALSYTWGDESDPKYPIYINGRRFEVRENLFHALHRFRSDGVALVIWIDAICINQTNDQERNYQVAKMTMIYEQATEVTVWLGPSYDDSDLAFQFMQELYEHRTSAEWVAERFSKPDMRQMLWCLAGLNYREYWRRVWIVQELTVARDIVLYCGISSARAECMLAVQQLLRRIHERDGFPKNYMGDILLPDRTGDDVRFLLTLGGINRIYSWKQDLILTKPSFYECLLHHYDKNASDPRDMIYGLAAMANRSSKYKIEIEYNLSTRTLFTNLAKLEIKTSKKLDIITRVAPCFDSHHLPSWVTDWAWGHGLNHSFLYAATQPEFRFYSAAESQADVAFNGDVMTFKGITIGYIDLHGPKTNMTDPWDAKNGILAVQNFWETVAGGSRTDHEAFVRTLICNKITRNQLGRHAKSEFLLDLLGHLSQFFTDSDLDQFGSSILSEYWNFYLSGRGVRWPVGAEEHSCMQSWMHIIFGNIWDRRFFVSSSKAMGIATKEVIEGDIICIPLGCCHPIILRRVKDHYINLGEVFVDGYMYGEAMDLLERGHLKLEEFKLH